MLAQFSVDMDENFAKFEKKKSKSKNDKFYFSSNFTEYSDAPNCESC